MRIEIDKKKNQIFDDAIYIKSQFIQIGKACGHRGNDDSVKSMGEGVFNRYCLGDDYSNNANNYGKMKVLCDDLKSYKEDKNEDSFKKIVQSYNDFKTELVTADEIKVESPIKYLENIVNFFDKEKQNKIQNKVGDTNKNTSPLKLRKNK